MSVGIRNNNYLNLKQPGRDKWRDAGDKDSRIDSKGHAIFSDPAWGVRAGILQLRAYYFNAENPRRTVASILARWAPASDTIGGKRGGEPNSPSEYTAFVCRRMGVAPDQILEIFQPDRTIGNIAQLRALFEAMAAYEIGGGFKVPEKVFLAGLELVEPGIRTTGTETHVLEETLSVDDFSPSQTWLIRASVGRTDRGAVNNQADVKTVQQMLRQVAMNLDQPSLDPGALDGKIGKNPRTSPTLKAIHAFQSRFLVRPDGLIEVGGRTWQELVRALEHGPVASMPSDLESTEEYFPFSSLPSADWTTPPRCFGARRNGGRAHAGCDLYFPAGTLIHAISSGQVIRGPYPFYAGTYALEIDHGTFLARYGEIHKDTLVRAGDYVSAGQPIAKVGHLVGISVPSDMLHLEIYEKTSVGPLNAPASTSRRTADGRPFYRRMDLIDPAPRLAQWKDRLAPTPQSRPAAISSVANETGTFVLRVNRQREERDRQRTIGTYECLWNGKAIPGLSGQVVERQGPGDNTSHRGSNQHSRIRAGSYQLAVHFGGKYRTTGYASGTDPNVYPQPGLLLENTGERSFILIHPGQGYVKSIGCLNLASNIAGKNSRIDFADSRNRVIAVIDALRNHLGSRFPRSGRIPGATIVVEGEPG